jgi:hypothetical protein
MEDKQDLSAKIMVGVSAMSLALPPNFQKHQQETVLECFRGTDGRLNN